MGVVALAAIFHALGQASQGEPEARRHALDAALRLCVEQAATAALGRPLVEAEQRALVDKVLPEANTFVDRFRVMDEGEGGGERFVYVEADVALSRLVRGLAPAAPSVKTNLTRQRGAPMLVRGTGKFASAVRVFGDVLVGDQHVGVVDETAWGFGPSEAAAGQEAESRADRAARIAAYALAASSDVAPTATLWVSVRGFTHASQAVSLHQALVNQIPGVREARLVRAGAGRADYLLETGAAAADLAASLEALSLDGFSLAAASAPGGGEVRAEILAR